mgnify:CR=1 FL=1
MTTPILFSIDQANRSKQEASCSILRGNERETRSSVKLPQHTSVMHVLQLLPEPYPEYPTLITRVISVSEACKIDERYGVSGLPSTGKDITGHFLNYKRLARRIYQDGEDSLAPHEEAFVQFVNTIYFFCYENDFYGEKLSLTYKTRHARGAVVCNPNREVALITALDDNLVDQALEMALQKRDFQAIRAILNFEGYGIPIKEPNDLVIPAAWGVKKTRESEVVEIEITPEEYEVWQEIQKSPPEEITEPAPFRNTPEFKSFAEAMSKSIPLHLEHAIRQRDIPTLRMWLRLYGRHNIAAPDPGTALVGSSETQEPPGTPPPPDL